MSPQDEPAAVEADSSPEAVVRDFGPEAEATAPPIIENPVALVSVKVKEESTEV